LHHCFEEKMGAGYPRSDVRELGRRDRGAGICWSRLGGWVRGLELCKGGGGIGGCTTNAREGAAKAGACGSRPEKLLSVRRLK
jgi:hypothetical protein